jgi:general secretion pathway protein F
VKYFEIVYRRGKQRHAKVYEAHSRQVALKQFQKEARGVMLSIKECNQPLSLRVEKLKAYIDNPIKNKRVPEEPYIAFLDQLSTMIDAGLPVNTCLSQCVEDTSEPMIQAIFSDILADIESGQGLTKSAQRYKRQLGTLTLSMFDLGEQTGSLGQSIGQLSKILQQIFDNRQKLKKATRYPMFIIFAMMAAFSVVITFVVPQFESFFRESKMELPFPTKLLLWLEASLSAFGPIILGGAIVIAGVLSYMYKKNKTWQLAVDRAILKVYIIGKVTHYAMIGRFVYLFEVLTEAGIPMIDALRISQGVVDNRYIKQELDKIPEAIEDGRSLTQGFRESAQFENMVIQMIKAGESSGSLGNMLSKINRLYATRYNYIVDNVATMIEPILIAAIAGFILILALGIFLPMWSMVDLAG